MQGSTIDPVFVGCLVGMVHDGLIALSRVGQPPPVGGDLGARLVEHDQRAIAELEHGVAYIEALVVAYRETAFNSNNQTGESSIRGGATAGQQATATTDP